MQHYLRISSKYHGTNVAFPSLHQGPAEFLDAPISPEHQTSGCCQNHLEGPAPVVEGNKLPLGDGELGIGLAGRVAEFHFVNAVRQQFNHSAHFARAEFARREVLAQRHGVQQFDGLPFHQVGAYFTSVLQNFSMRSRPFSMFAMLVA